MIDEAMSILQYKGNKVQDPDQAFRMALRSFSNRQKKKELLKVKIQEIIFQAQFGNSMAPGYNCTKSNDANTANHLSNRNSDFPELTKKLACSIYFTSTN